MKTIYIAICLLAFVSCKKETVDPNTKVEETTLHGDSPEVRFMGNWQQFSGEITYGNGSNTFINMDGYYTSGPSYRPLYNDEGFRIPCSFFDKLQIEGRVRPNAKYNMKDGEWVVIGLYKNGILLQVTDTLTKLTLGVTTKDYVKK